MKSRYAALSVLALVLAACGGTAAPTTQPGQVQPTTQPGQPTSPPVIGGAGTSVAHVVVASGPLAGTYDVTGIKYDCNISPSGSGATFLDLSLTEGLYTVTFSSVGGGANPTAFYFQALFGGVSSNDPGIEIQTLDPANPRGSGTAALQDNGATIKWSINGTSSDGIGVQATVECGPVDRRSV